MNRGNLFQPLPQLSRDEVFEDLLRGGAFRLERIVSTGQATPQGQWYDQDTAEWVVLLSGSASLRFADEDALHEMRPGDWVLIAPHRRHRVEHTDAEQATVWLALHIDPEPS